MMKATKSKKIIENRWTRKRATLGNIFRTSMVSICRSASPSIGLTRRSSSSRATAIFITCYGDVPMTVQAIKAGAVEFLTKPLGDDVLLSAIRNAIDRSRTALGHEAGIRELRDCHASLTLANGRSWRGSCPAC
jgi:DNA-binding NtrC family response regulator